MTRIPYEHELIGYPLGLRDFLGRPLTVPEGALYRAARQVRPRHD